MSAPTQVVHGINDRRSWPAGPWDGEPDKVVWVDDATSLDCMIHRSPNGALCGYAAVPPGHPYHGVFWDAYPVNFVTDEAYARFACIEVHGGINYSNSCRGDAETGLCHTPQSGRPHDVWWFGFDCAHCYDLVPIIGPIDSDDRYRDLEWVSGEVQRLARQLAAVPS